MSLVRCSNCGEEIEESLSQCPICGEILKEEDVQDNSLNYIICQECGNSIQEDSLVCPFCGYPIKSNSAETKNEQENGLDKKKTIQGKTTIGIVLSIIAIICLIVGGTRVINNDEYEFYLDHYDRCSESYNEMVITANSYSYGFFRSAYQDLADDYAEMMKRDKKKIWTYRGQAIALGTVGSALLILGGVLIKREKDAKKKEG